ncbi:hypothetical protein TSMEX_011472 [Taenia solium]|eukprot:TsM_000906400 transcript=TsM_000906400 gene=TsM_000906400
MAIIVDSYCSGTHAIVDHVSTYPYPLLPHFYPHLLPGAEAEPTRDRSVPQFVLEVEEKRDCDDRVVLETDDVALKRP